jgi:hypothetical protein
MSDVSEGQKSSSAPTPKTPLYGTEREHFVWFPTQTLPALPPPLRNELAAAGVLGGVAVGAGGSPDTGSARSGSRCAIRSLLRSSVTGHGGGRTAQSHLLLVRSSVLAPSSGRRARGGFQLLVRLSFRFYYANLIILALNLHTEQSENVASFVAVDRVGSASPHSQRNASSTPAHTHPGGHTNRVILHASCL